MKKTEHPYQKYEKSPIWKPIERAVAQLIANGDIVEQTDRKYIVGYLCRQLISAGEFVPAVHQQHNGWVGKTEAGAIAE